MNTEILNRKDFHILTYTFWTIQDRDFFINSIKKVWFEIVNLTSQTITEGKIDWWWGHIWEFWGYISWSKWNIKTVIKYEVVFWKENLNNDDNKLLDRIMEYIRIRNMKKIKLSWILNFFIAVFLAVIAGAILTWILKTIPFLWSLLTNTDKAQWVTNLALLIIYIALMIFNHNRVTKINKNNSEYLNMIKNELITKWLL